MVKTLLEIKKLQVSASRKDIIKGIDLTVKQGETHVIMGPNGSGKSTLATILLGHPDYQIGGISRVLFNGRNLLTLSTSERVKLGLFLSFQTPVTIPGVSVINLLHTAYAELNGKETNNMKIQNPVLSPRGLITNEKIRVFQKYVDRYISLLNINKQLLYRSWGEGFSGGEKKKMEIFTALLLRPKLVIFDEIDTGLDIDALKFVARGIKLLHDQNTAVVVITHYQRMLKYFHLDYVHIMVGGRIVKSGDKLLAAEIEKAGYGKYL